MNEKEKQEYLEKYDKAKKKGVPFFPDILFKDAVVSLGLFILLIALAYFIGAPLEERANPSDTSYTPRPEWYFLFLFQLLKYFPGELEFIGVVVLPTIAILLLFALPFIDSSKVRYFTKRKGIVSITALMGVAVIVLTILSVVEAPPPAEAAKGDVVAALYAKNCAGCHGAANNVPQVSNLHEVIAEGNHEGMPSWSGDLTSDQIDALVGFILSPAGNTLFGENCSECHQATDLTAGDSVRLREALVQGAAFSAHQGLDLPDWSETLTGEERTSLLNFLIAPDGQRLFTTNCSSCHGSSVAVNGDAEVLHETIVEGGMHLEMPGWQGMLTEDQINLLAMYVVDPAKAEGAEEVYQQNCVACHFDRIPRANTFDEAYQVIATGGSHETMPVWGDSLTDEQIDALVGYVVDAARGTSAEAGRQIYVDYCASCHGEFGEGGPNPSLSGDVIAPISTAEYLSTRDDVTLRAVIEQGQPNFGMSPFGLSNGGPLDNEQVDALVTYIRSWQANPPVELPPEVESGALALSGAEIFQGVCAQCHGVSAQGGVGPSLRSPDFRSENTADDVFTTISAGHEATSMIAWGGILSSEQLTALVEFILSLPEAEGEDAGGVSYALSVVPVFEAKCVFCHNADRADGGWDASSYTAVIESGDNGPAVIPGDAENSLLAQKLLDTQEQGDKMPPMGSMEETEIQVILDWIAAGAPDN